MNGWICLHRKLLESPIFSNEKALKIWIWCLLKASHCDYTQMIGLTNVELKQGQFIFGRNKASEELNINANTIYKYMKQFEKSQMLVIKSNNKYSVVTIEKWAFYQNELKENNNKITTKEQQNNTNNNITTKQLSSSSSSKILEVYQKNIGTITPIMFERLNYIINDYPEELILKAIEISVMNNKRTLNYIEGILKNWNLKGYKTVADIQENKVVNYPSKKENWRLSDEERRKRDEEVIRLLREEGIEVE